MVIMLVVGMLHTVCTPEINRISGQVDKLHLGQDKYGFAF